MTQRFKVSTGIQSKSNQKIQLFLSTLDKLRFLLRLYSACIYTVSQLNQKHISLGIRRNAHASIHARTR